MNYFAPTLRLHLFKPLSYRQNLSIIEYPSKSTEPANIENIWRIQEKGSAHMPLAVRTHDGTIGFKFIKSSDDHQGAIGSVNSFLKTYQNSKAIILYTEIPAHMKGKTIEPKIISPRVMLAPLVAIAR